MAIVNSYSSIVDLKAATASGAACLVESGSVPDGVFFWTTGNFTGQADDIDIIKANSTGLGAGAWVRQTSDSTTFLQSGTGAVTRPVQTKLRESISVKDFGARGDGTGDDRLAIQRAVQAATGAFNIFRTPASEVHFPAGTYRIAGPMELAPVEGLVGMTFSGVASGSVDIVLATADATISCRSSRAITWRDINFRSYYPKIDGGSGTYGIDLNQTCFTIAQGATDNTLKQWRFERCEFAAFYRCFAVTGDRMCDGFNFARCQFSQCYILKENFNIQAVNWNFSQCTYENEALETTKDKNKAAMFWIHQGDSVVWTGGGIIGHGYWLYFDLQARNTVFLTSHFWTFADVRGELETSDSSAPNAGFHSPLVGRLAVADGFKSPGNKPDVLFRGVKLINRGDLSDSTIYADLWDNLTLRFEGCAFESGDVVGRYGDLSETQFGSISIVDCAGISYRNDNTGKLLDHLSHRIHIEGSDRQPDQDIGTGGQALSRPRRTMRFTGTTGTIPQGGTTVALMPLLDGSVIDKVYIRAWANLTQDLTVEVRKADDSAGYGSVTVTAGSSFGETYIGREMGFQIPTGQALMLKMAGTATVDKGEVGIEYL